MWLFTTFGFFSVVAERENAKNPPEKHLLVVRARVKKDLERLKDKYLPNASDILEIANRDYPYRVYAWKSDFQRAMPKIVEDVTYHNFKSEVEAKDSLEREQMYAQVWSVMYNAEKKLKDKARENAKDRRWAKGQGALFKSESGKWYEKGYDFSNYGEGKGYTVRDGGLVALDRFEKPDPLKDPFFVSDTGTVPDAQGKQSPRTVDYRDGTSKRCACPWCDHFLAPEKHFTGPEFNGKVQRGFFFECPKCSMDVIVERTVAVRSNKGKNRINVRLGCYEKKSGAYVPDDVPPEEDPTLRGFDAGEPREPPPDEEGEIPAWTGPDDAQEARQDAHDAEVAGESPGTEPTDPAAAVRGGEA